MDTADLKEMVEFALDEPMRKPVFETERLWSQLLCLGRNQRLGPLTDPNADAILAVVAGEVVLLVEGKRRRLHQWETALVPAGSELSLANASQDPLVILLVTAPPPVAEDSHPQSEATDNQG